MILDKLKNCSKFFSMGTRFETGFKFILENDLSKFADGKYEIDGENIFALVSSYATKSAAEKLPEAHRKYADIQYMISGYENIGYAHLGSQKVTTDYNDEKDIIFYDEVSFYFRLPEGSFAVFLPDDIHMPGIIDGEAMEVRKVVVKVRL
jgi:YhcH/YjgK/YiaL family protein